MGEEAMQINIAEVGERYDDNSGWERRVLLDVVKENLTIEIMGSSMSAHSSDIDWLIEALETVRKTCSVD